MLKKFSTFHYYFEKIKKWGFLSLDIENLTAEYKLISFGKAEKVYNGIAQGFSNTPNMYCKNQRNLRIVYWIKWTFSKFIFKKMGFYTKMFPNHFQVTEFGINYNETANFEK